MFDYLMVGFSTLNVRGIRVAPFISLIAKIVYDSVLWLMIYYTTISGSFGPN